MEDQQKYKPKTDFYSGADYGFDSSYGNESFLGYSGNMRFPASSFAVTTDPRVSSQLKAVSDKVSTGAKAIEVTGITPAEWESIPQQHLKELNRLKKLVGVDLTLHGPLIEPTGVTRNGWNETDRQQAENQLWSALERSHDLDPKGNIIVTFHSSNGLPEPQTVVVNPKTGREEISDFWVVDERTGSFTSIQPKTSYFKSEDKMEAGSFEDQKKKLVSTIEEQNKDSWYRNLQGVSYHANLGSESMERVLPRQDVTKLTPQKQLETSKVLEIYKKMGSPEFEEEIKSAGELEKPIREKLNDITHADIYLRDAYQQLQSIFNQAYEAAKKENRKDDLKKLDVYRDELKPKLGYIEDPLKVKEFADEIVKGVTVLRGIKEPQVLRPLRDFALEKASETFSNLAVQSFDKFGNNAPIISIENPPAGMGLSRGQDLRELVEQSQNKFIEKAILPKSDGGLGMDKSHAESEAKKLIGVTWDVGHINMIRKYGYDQTENKKQITAETAKIAPYIKHIHLSDNFGMEHTELPMGMGNVPLKEHLATLQKGYSGQIEKLKKVIETGGSWYRDFKVTPLKETLQAFGSPVYAMEMGPYWNTVAQSHGGYFAGYGNMLPQQHFSTYGSGFSAMPVELGGQLSGRSRMTGAPME